MSGPRRRIAVFLPDLRGGGVERMRIALAREWLAAGHAVDFVLMQRAGELLSLVPDGARVLDLGVRRLRGALAPLVRYLRAERPDALLAAMWPLTVIAPLAGRLSGTARVVVSEHSVVSESYRDRGRAHRWALEASTALGYRLAHERVAVSTGVAADLAQLSRIGREAFRVVHNPAGGLTPTRSSDESVVRCARPTVLAVGNLKPVKDHETLIRAFARLDASVAATLCILGEGQLRPALESLVKDLGLEERVLLPGFRRDTAPYYAQADLFVLSSRHEGFGNVLVEALEAGIPVVSTDCPGGPREILADGRYGALVPVGDVQALSRAMAAALGGAQQVTIEERRARAAEFDVRRVARRYLELLFPQDAPA